MVVGRLITLLLLIHHPGDAGDALSLCKCCCYCCGRCLSTLASINCENCLFPARALAIGHLISTSSSLARQCVPVSTPEKDYIVGSSLRANLSHYHVSGIISNNPIHIQHIISQQALNRPDSHQHHPSSYSSA